MVQFEFPVLDLASLDDEQLTGERVLQATLWLLKYGKVINCETSYERSLSFSWAVVMSRTADLAEDNREVCDGS